MKDKNFLHSSFREKLIEHLFIGELLKLDWRKGDCQLEIARSEVDNGGSDIIAEANGVIRHIQLKSMRKGGTAKSQNVNLKLADKPSGCVVWIVLDDETAELGPFYFFGGEAGMPLPDISRGKPAKNTRGNSLGEKAERPNIRKVGRARFTCLESLDDVYRVLFLPACEDP